MTYSRIGIVSLLLLVSASRADSQASLTPREVHDRIAAIIRRRSPETDISGDTSVTWYKGPILYHVVQDGPDRMRSEFLRNDSLVGLADFAWDSAGPQAFTVAWLAADSFEVRIHGERSGSQLIISGTRDTTYSIPSLPWAVADYGMEEHIVPILRRLPMSDGIQRVAVYRPYGGQWDTLSLALSTAAEGSLRVREVGDKDTTLWVIDQDGALLQLTHSQSQGERRPLEETRLYAAYRRLRFMPIDLK